MLCFGLSNPCVAGVVAAAGKEEISPELPRFCWKEWLPRRKKQWQLWTLTSNNKGTGIIAYRKTGERCRKTSCRSPEGWTAGIRPVPAAVRRSLQRGGRRRVAVSRRRSGKGWRSDLSRGRRPRLLGFFFGASWTREKSDGGKCFKTRSFMCHFQKCPTPLKLLNFWQNSPLKP